MAEDKTNSPYQQGLRRRAEEKLRAALPEGGENDERLLLGLVQELQIHQVELEIQNEELRRTQAELARSQAEYVDLYDQAPVGYLSLDRDGRILRVNLATAALLTAERDRLIGRSFLIHVADKDREIFYHHLREVARKERRAGCELHLVRKTGEEFAARLESVPIKRENGAIECRTSLLDITERTRLEEVKRQALELLAGGIAHDFNNLLTAMLGNISLAQVHLEPGGQPREKLALAERAALGARDLVKQLLIFSGRGAAEKEIWGTAALIRKAVELPLKITGSRHDLTLADDLWPVAVDSVRFSQVMQNLIINAGQAMPQGGTITIGAENRRLVPEEQPALAAGEYVRIVVEDQGAGISPDNRSKIFDPYFSTKLDGHGLGLAVSRSIVEQFGGVLTEASRPGEGARFEIYLPAAAAQPEAAQEKRTEGEPRTLSGQGRILIMDDDPSIREVVAAMLAFLGYETEKAPEGRTAIALFKEAKDQREPFAAVILDLMVPGGMGGQETVKLLQQLDPGVKAIVSSGYAKEPVVESFQDYGFVASLPKPYTLKQIGLVLRKVLEKVEVG